MRIRRINFDSFLFTIDNARVWNNQMSPYFVNDFGGQHTNKTASILPTWREEIGERAFAAYFTECIMGDSNYVSHILTNPINFRNDN